MVWGGDPADPQPVARIDGAKITDAAVSTVDAVVLTAYGAYDDRRTCMYDLECREELAKPVVHDNGIQAFAISDCARRVATVSLGVVRVLEWETTPTSADLHLAGEWEHKGADQVVISAEGSTVVSYSSYNRPVTVRCAPTHWACEERLEHKAPPQVAAVSFDGSVVVTSSPKDGARLWRFDRETGAQAPGSPAALAVGGTVRAAAFSAEGDRVVVAGSDARGGVAWIWDVGRGRLSSQIHVPYGEVSAVRFASDGERLLTISGRDVAVWDVDSGTECAHLDHDETVVDARMLTSRGLVATAAGRFVYLWDCPTGSSTSPEAQAGPADAVALLADVAAVASGSEVGPDGVLVPVVDRYARLVQLEERLSTLPPGDRTPAARIAEWFVTPRDRRTISPFSTVTVDDYVTRLIGCADRCAQVPSPTSGDDTWRLLRRALNVLPGSEKVQAAVERHQR